MQTFTHKQLRAMAKKLRSDEPLTHDDRETLVAMVEFLHNPEPHELTVAGLVAYMKPLSAFKKG